MATTYTVKSGDNLTAIAKQHNITVEKLAQLNGIKDANKISVGQKLIFAQPAKQQPVTEPQVSQKQLQDELAKVQNQFNTLQQQMNKENGNDISGLEMFGYGLAGAATLKGAQKAMPFVKDVAETGALRAMYAGDKLKAVKDKASQGIKHAAKKAELEYAFAKDALKQTGKSAAKQTASTAKTVGDATVNCTKKIANASQNTAIKSGKIMKLTKVGKAVGKKLPGLAQTIAVAEVAVAYNNGGTKAAAKQAVKSGSGIAMGAAGTKIGAAIGTAICPGIGTAVGAVVGGVAGYIAGEGLADKVISWFS